MLQPHALGPSLVKEQSLQEGDALASLTDKSTGALQKWSYLLCKGLRRPIEDLVNLHGILIAYWIVALIPPSLRSRYLPRLPRRDASPKRLHRVGRGRWKIGDLWRVWPHLSSWIRGPTCGTAGLFLRRCHLISNSQQKSQQHLCAIHSC